MGFYHRLKKFLLAEKDSISIIIIWNCYLNMKEKKKITRGMEIPIFRLEKMMPIIWISFLNAADETIHNVVSLHCHASCIYATVNLSGKYKILR